MFGRIEIALLALAAFMLLLRLLPYFRPYHPLFGGGCVLLLITALFPRPENPLGQFLFGTTGDGIKLPREIFGIVWWIPGAWLCKSLFELVLSRTLFPDNDKPHARRLFADLASGLIYVTAFVGIVFKEPVSTFLATSGVVAIVLGLALQNTLGDVFAGLDINIERPFSAGDWITLAGQALGGLSGCGYPSNPDGHYTPAVNQAANIVPGKPNYYATALLDGGTAAGIVVRQDMGRPVKIEGNPAHPASLGATSIYGQALLLDFYDPDRACGIMTQGDVASVQALQRALAAQRAALQASQGQGFRILTGRVVSPTLGAAIADLLRQYPRAQWHQWQALSRDAVRQGSVLAYGAPLDIVPHVARADVILALENDLITQAPGHLRAFARHLFRGGAFSLHHGGRHGVGLFRRAALLVAENHRPHVSRNRRPGGRGHDLLRLQPHLLPAIHPGL
jgi:hypothetical protein